jgi:hypothetical protein
VARTRLHLAELLHAAGGADEARVTLAAARAGFTALQVPIWDSRAVELGSRLGLGA